MIVVTEPSSWGVVSGVTAVVSTIAIVVGAIVALHQLKQMTNASKSQSFIAVVNLLQSDEARRARAVVFSLAGSDSRKWRGAELEAAERTCHLYNSAGVMVHHGLLPKDMVIDRWMDSLRRSWSILEPLVRRYRAEREAPEFWADFEWLALQARRRSARV